MPTPRIAQTPAQGHTAQAAWSLGAPGRMLALAALGVVGVFMVLSSWVGDDAYIMLRVVRNMVEGHGMVYNVGERVNPASDPLWALLLWLCCGLTREYFVTPQLLNILFALSAVWVAMRRFGAGLPGQLLVAGLCLASKAFMDFTTAGLENALMFFLLTLLLALTLPQQALPERGPRQASRLFYTVLLAGLTGLCRPDAVLLAAPPALWAFYQTVFARRELSLGRAVRLSALGLLPFVLWYAFAVVYYGMPFPNTYYAKVLVQRFSHIPAAEILFRGALYYISALQQDPLTLLMLGLGVGCGAVGGSQGRVWAATVLLYLAYVLAIGGDFMMGRFFAAPYLIAVVLLVRLAWPAGTAYALALAALALASARPKPFYTYGQERSGGLRDDRGLSDERACYFWGSGLVSTLRPGHSVPDFPWYAYGTRCQAFGSRIGFFPNVGMFGFALGAQTYLIDPYGLSDSFLARLARQPRNWRVGHFFHAMPAGFLESKITGKNRITDPRLARLYAATQLLARGPLWTAERWRAIWEMNTGQYDALSDGYYDYPRQELLHLDARTYLHFEDKSDPRIGPLVEEYLEGKRPE